MASRFRFGHFVFDSAQGVLLKHGAPVEIGGKCLILLEALLRAKGRAVSKSDLMDAAWQTQIVEESNLSVQIAALRKCLGTSGDGREWIQTVQRVGYRFAGPAEAASSGDDVAAVARPLLGRSSFFRS